MVKPHCSNIRIITAIFLVPEFLGFLQYTVECWKYFDQPSHFLSEGMLTVVNILISLRNFMFFQRAYDRRRGVGRVGRGDEVE